MRLTELKNAQGAIRADAGSGECRMVVRDCADTEQQAPVAADAREEFVGNSCGASAGIRLIRTNADDTVDDVADEGGGGAGVYRAQVHREGVRDALPCG